MIDKIATHQGSSTHIFAHIALPLGLYIFVWIIQPFIFRTWDYIRLRLYPRMQRDITMQMFSYLNKHSDTYFQDQFGGSLQNKITDLTDGIPAIMTKIEQGIGTFMLTSIAVLTMTWVNPLFGMILAGWICFFLLITWLLFGKVKKKSMAFAQARTQYIGHIVDSIANMHNIRLFARRKYEVRRISKSIDHAIEKNTSMQWMTLRLRALWDITTVIMMIFLLLALLSLYSEGKVTIGDFSFIMMLATSVFHIVWWYAESSMELAERAGKCSQALTILNTAHGVTDLPDAKPLQVKQGAISFEKVTFAYEKGNPIFKEKEVRIAPGEKVGLVGFSGSGKTTFVNLLLRLFDLDKGRITIDGQDIKSVTQESLRMNITMIPQDTSLFHRSLIENIRYGRATATDEEVVVAAKKALCHDFIQALPEKYDTLVGERGVKLSGGQRQRIAIARAFLKKTSIFFLDEATSALDSLTEKALQTNLDKLIEGRTTLVIAHRLSTLALMDRILVFDKGEIIEEGNHQTLLAKKGQYAHMWSMQAGGFLPTSR